MKIVQGQRVLYASLVISLFATRPAIPKTQSKVKSISGADVRTCTTKRILGQKPECIILHIGTNDALNLPPNEILDKILQCKIKIEAINKGCRVKKNFRTKTRIHYFTH